VCHCYSSGSRQRWARAHTRQHPSLLLVFLALGKSNALADNVGDESNKKWGLLERGGLVAKNLLVRGQACHKHGVRVAHVKVADQRRLRPAPHPGYVRLVGITAAELFEGMANEKVMVLGVCVSL